MTEDDSELRKLNAIVGSALKALAESGADDEFIGAFAASHRAKVAKILGQPEAVWAPPDLQTIVTQAVTQALAAAGVGKGQEGNKTPAKRINVLVGGRRTSVTLNPDTIARLIDAKGSKTQAASFIQELANSVPPGVLNRSGWVEDRLQAFLAFRSDDPGAASHRH